jgi:hypothetical protein
VQFDIGLVGLGLLVVIALAFGAIAQLAGRPGTRWQWLIAAVGWFIGGLFASEVVWGTLTEQQIQPIIDGLAVEESLLGGLIVGVAVVIATRYVTGGSPFHHRPTAA